MEQLLRDPGIPPSGGVLAAALGDSFAAWRELIEKLGAMEITLAWRYYNDGKVWLARGASGKKTAFWVSAWTGFFKMSLYFTERTRGGVQALPVREEIKAAIAKEPPRGRLIPLTLDIYEAAQLPDALALIEYKRRLR